MDAVEIFSYGPLPFPSAFHFPGEALDGFEVAGSSVPHFEYHGEVAGTEGQFPIRLIDWFQCRHCPEGDRGLPDGVFVFGDGWVHKFSGETLALLYDKISSD